MRKLKINFDSNGYIIPYEPTLMTFEDFSNNFLELFQFDFNKSQLLENWILYNESFQKNIFPYYEQWINGSFVTKKKTPKDIDIVSFLDYRVFEAKEKELENYWSFSLEMKGIDAYIVKSYPIEHPLFNNYLENRLIWNKRFNYDRIRAKKGFIKIIFEKEI